MLLEILQNSVGDIDAFISLITAAAAISVIVGVPVAIVQVRAAKRALQAEVLSKLIDEWRSEEVYNAAAYVHKLRADWKSFPTDEWNDLAKKWVEEHVGKTDSGGQEEKRLHEHNLLARQDHIEMPTGF